MCLPQAVRNPERVLATGFHAGYEYNVVHNGIGFRCGYVKVEPGHPWFGRDEDAIGTSVHGGLTFVGPDMHCDKGGEDNGWWLGFDCGHLGDSVDPELSPHNPQIAASMFGGVVRTTEYVVSECKSLCEQADLASREK